MNDNTKAFLLAQKQSANNPVGNPLGKGGFGAGLRNRR
jgi:hypothetical protein